MATSMRILFPIGSFYPAQVGGPSNTIYWLAKALAEEGCIVSVVAKKNGIKEEHNIVLNQWMKLNKFAVIYTKNWFHQLPFRMLYEALKQLKKHDIVILTSISYLPSIIIAFFSLFFKIKVIWSTRGELESTALLYNPILKRIRINVIKLFFKRNIVFHSTSASETKNIRQKLNPNKIIEIQNYMELPERVDYKVKNQFLFLGRVHSIKALDRIIEGLNKSTCFRDSDYIFIIVGPEGEKGYKSTIVQQVEDYGMTDKVQFLGSIFSEEKNRVYAESKYLFLLSHSENFGNVVIESLAQGTPVIASTGTPWEHLVKYGAGYWIKNDPVLVAETVDKIIQTKESDYVNIRRNSLKMAREKYDISKNIYRWLDVFMDMLKA